MLKKFALLMMMPFLAGCPTTKTGLVPGTGYVMVRPNAALAKALPQLDRVSAERIQINRERCRRDKGCRK